MSERDSAPNRAPGGRAAGGEPERVVVGVDGSVSSKSALRWAIRQAGLTHGVVEAVISWQLPPYYGSLGWMPSPVDYDPATTAERVLKDAVEEVAGQKPPVEIRIEVVHAGAADALLDAARDASLLVVGSRGHGGFTGAVLGSVAQHCTQHSPCPVVVVRGPDR
ncbi:universal stress protein [Streptomyces sp. NPDC051018]|uniref:universal stress protein n=1 Tax=Streptomyces sp. NPDC051018 TaxID=3365639 RepID=UPI0037B3B0D0